MFLYSRKDEVVPIAKIDWVDVSKREIDGRDYVQVHAGRSSYDVAREEWVRVLYTPIAHFPAQPGTVVVRTDGDMTFHTPVLGWVQPAIGPAMPVTVDGINDSSPADEYVTVMTGDGIVMRPEDRTRPATDAERSGAAA